MTGIYGGAFDPVHLGHMGVAAVARRALGGGARIVFVPTGIPPHRAGSVAPPQTRLRLLRAATAGEPRYEVSAYECDKAATSWTIDTLRHFAAPGGPAADAPLCLVMGSDAFKTIDRWHRWRELPDYAGILVVRRHGDTAALNATLADFYQARKATAADALAPCLSRRGGILMINAAVPAISSTKARAAIALVHAHGRGRGDDLSALLPRPVAAIIRDEKLYA